MSMLPDQIDTESFTLFKYRFTPETPGIFPGVPILSLPPSSILYGAFITVDQAWDGNTPHADISFAGGWTIFTSLGTGAVSLAAASAAFGGSLKPIQNLVDPLVLAPLAVQSSSNVIDPGAPSDVQPSREITLCASTTGASSGASSGSTVGSATVYLVVAQAIDLGIADTELAG